MSEASTLLSELIQRARTFALLVPMCTFSSATAGLTSDHVELDTYTFSASPASYLGEAEQQDVHIERLTHELGVTGRVLRYLKEQRAPEYCHPFVAILDSYFAHSDLERAVLDTPEVWSRMLANARGFLLEAVPNAGEWYRLINVIEPGANPPLPERFITTVELEPLGFDWAGLEAGLWAQDIARQLDGDC